ncbi:MAG: glycosyltransferase [Planctomycetota bacterium]|nr:glycosyltransferase [Planctomycetota bacterium]
MIKVGMFHSENSAVGYYRIWQPAKWLEKLGLAEVRRIPDDMSQIPIEKADRIDNIGPCGSFAEYGEWADVLVFQRVNTIEQYSCIEAIRKVYNKPIIFELDDNISHVDRRHIQYDVFKRKNITDVYDIVCVPAGEARRFKKRQIVAVQIDPSRIGYRRLIMRKEGAEGLDVVWLTENMAISANAIFTTCELLKHVLSKFNRNIHILKNCIDFEMWDPLPPVRDKRKVIIGWAGGGQHKPDLQLVCGIIGDIIGKYPNVNFHWGRCREPRLMDLAKKYPRQVRYFSGVPFQKYHTQYARWNFDIGIAPVWDTPFNRCKSNIKYLENAARKIPTVASAIITYTDIKHGETGFLCGNDPKEWYDNLVTLIEKPELRKKMGQAAYDHVKAEYNARDNAPRYVKALQEVVTKYKEGASNAIEKGEKQECCVIQHC